MKKLLLISFAITFSTLAFAQNPELSKTWHLVSYSMDLGGTIYISDIEPFIDPTLVIDDQLGFTGLVCNQYGGEFIYDSNTDRLTIDFYGLCLCGTCINPPQSIIDLEEDYFGYFEFPESIEYEIYTTGEEGNDELRLTFAPGFDLIYQENPFFSVADNNLSKLSIYPNPAKDKLFISSKNITLQSFSIYSIKGEKLISEKLSTNAIDISRLSKGVYFIEINSENGKDVQKFIKE